MWRRNLLFLSLMGGGLLWLAHSVGSPLRQIDTASGRSGDWDSASFQETVERINRAMRADWARAKLRPAAEAPVLTLARRVSLALCGTIPSLEEIRLIESLGTERPIPRWVDHLLADRRSADYLAERLARQWVGVEEGPFLLYRRRRFVHWLSDALYAHRPYDAIVRDIVASEGLWTDQPATNFITVAIANEEEGPDENKLAVRVCRSMLGVRLDCAQCHDHPFQPRWRQRDFQGLAAFFGSTQQSLTGIHDTTAVYRVEDRETGQMREIEPAVPYAADLLPAEGRPRWRLARWLTDPENRPPARAMVNRMWALLFGRALVEPVDDMPIDGPFPPALEALATDFAAHGYDLQRLIRLITATDAFRRDSRSAGQAPAAADGTPADGGDESGTEATFRWSRFPLTRLRPEQVVGGLLQSASLTTLDSQSHIVLRILRDLRQADFVARYGDPGQEEWSQRAGTIPQRLLMLNGELVFEATKNDLIGNAATRVASFAPSDRQAVEVIYLTVLTRRPTGDEQTYFLDALAGCEGDRRAERIEDLAWTLLNSTEFSWNH